MRLIARNGNFYTISELPEGFWTEWKTNKDEMKAQGNFPFKRNGAWYLSRFTKEKATDDQIKEFKQNQLETFIGYLNLEPQTEEQIKVFEKVQNAETVDDALNIIKVNSELFENSESLVNEALDALFEKNLE